MKKPSTKSTVRGPLSAGVDVGKYKLHLGFSDDPQVREFSNDEAGFTAIEAELKRRGVIHVGMESTASYSAALAEALRETGFDVTVFQPKQIKAFAQFKLKRAKSDNIDAPIIAQCTALSEAQPAPDVRLAAFCELLTFCDQLDEDVRRTKTRLEQARNPEIRQFLSEDIKRLSILRRGRIKALVEAVRQHADLAHRMDLVRSIDGIGEIGALALILRMPELGSVSREQAAALLGVAPFVRESGRFKGERHIAGGRARARRTMFAAAQAACQRWNKALIALYQRHTAKGMHHTAAVIACARKLVIYANTVLHRQKPWTKNLENQPV